MYIHMYTCVDVYVCVYTCGLQSADPAVVRLSLMMCSWQSDLQSKKFRTGSKKFRAGSRKKGWIEVCAEQKKKQIGFRFMV